MTKLQEKEKPAWGKVIYYFVLSVVTGISWHNGYESLVVATIVFGLLAVNYHVTKK